MTTLMDGLHSPEDGHVLVDGFYDDVRPLPEDIKEAWSRLPFDPAAFGDRLRPVGAFRGAGLLADREALGTADPRDLWALGWLPGARA